MPEKSSDKGAPTRAQAARAVAAVLEGRSMDAALATAQEKISAPADRALVAAMTFGVIREWRFLDALAARMWKRPPPPLAQALVLVGLYQLRAMRVPPHAAVHATVAATNALRMPKLRGMVNALLRRYQRDQAKLEAGLKPLAGVQTSHPDWLLTALQADWPKQWQSVLTENNCPAPMVLRVNTRKITRDAYIQRLLYVGLNATPHAAAPQALCLESPVPVESLPGFAEGQVSVQDTAAQLAAPLLNVAPGMRVLDACAAPGGKAAHILELSDCNLLALDIDEARVGLVQETFKRLGVAGTARCADASQPEPWWDGKPFDRILVDAPCTGTGVIRRHPDIKWLRREADVAAMAKRQRALLNALWPLLAPNGLLVYATCSTLRAGGASTVADFVRKADAVTCETINSDWGTAETVGRRIRPGQDGMDGFYYACLRKR